MENHPVSSDDDDNDQRSEHNLNGNANTSSLDSQDEKEEQITTNLKCNVVKLSELVRREAFKEGTFSKRFEGRGYKLVVEKYDNDDYKIKRYPLPDTPIEEDTGSEGCEIWDDCPRQVKNFPHFLRLNSPSF
ncbi:unnamed protein product [Enterobius vermicularis]|uniref:Protein kinase domain-containing protein n=1 Tax=Enterobius vermicularis TaxID=51028 RepID=A0A0N4UX18_ENTVE|nr:unnamed protein product [Enterobius vermicularis]